jgi:predicted acetyltransferase
MKVYLKELQPIEEYDVFQMVDEIGEGENGFGNSLWARNEEDFREFLTKNYEYSKGMNLRPNFVPQTIYFLFVDGQPVGYGKLRHYLNEALKEHGGHIGYTIRPSERGKGYGNVILAEIVKKAQEMNIREVLLTCNEGNFRSRKVIEHNKGLLIELKNGRCKYVIKLD